MSNRILVANIGSTSFKFQLLEMPEEKLIATGRVERIGSASSPWQLQVTGGETRDGENTFADQVAAISFIANAVEKAGAGSFREVAAFGFKPVMAKGFSGTQVLDEPVLQAMEAFYTLLPAHNPPYVNAVRAFNALYPNIPCIGTFETAFYDQLPEAATWFPVSVEWRVKYGIRRNGFHGASHRYVTQRVAEIRGTKALRIISCHLGGSSSICAVKDGVAIDSSWGMTAQSGLPHNNRAGDFDVFALIYLLRDVGLGLDEVERILSTNSGLKGMSGLNSGDIRDLNAAASSGNQNAKMAIEVFVNTIRGFIGRFIVALGGLDVLVFTAGIGENDGALRARICQGMEFLGLELDPNLNLPLRAKEALISKPSSTVEVRVIPTNEEIVIARNAWAKLQENQAA